MGVIALLQRPLAGALCGVAVAVALALGIWIKSPSPNHGGLAAVTTFQQPNAQVSEKGSRKEQPIERPGAMRDFTTYAAERLQEIKYEPAVWADAEKWRLEFQAAPSTELQNEVLGLAKQIGSEAFLAVLPQALASSDRFVRLDAVRSISFLHEDKLLLGVTIAIAATDSEVRAEVMDLIEQTAGSRQPQLLRETLASPDLDVQKRSVELLAARPCPASFGVLIDGLRAPDPAVQSMISEAIEGMVDHHFDNYVQATQWWATNRDRYDEMMLLAK